MCGIDDACGPGGVRRASRRLRAHARRARVRGARARPPLLRRARATGSPTNKYHCDVNLVHAVMAGLNPLTQNLWDLQRGARRARAAPARRRDAASESSASPTARPCTLFLAAIDDRVRAAVVSGYLSSWKAAHRVPWNMCGSQVMAGMLGSARARRRRRARRAAAAAGRDRRRGPSVPRSRGARRRSPSSAAVYRSARRARRRVRARRVRR